MAGPNTTGLPQTEDYQLGRGIIYLGVIDTTTGLVTDDGWRDLGNAPAFSITANTENLTHQSSRGGLAVTDLEVLLRAEFQISFSIDEINAENLSMFFFGTQAAFTNPSVAGFTEHAMIAAVKLGRHYEVVNSAGVHAYGFTASDLVMTKEASPSDIALVVGTDYTVDPIMGTIFLKSTASNIADGDTLNATLTANATAGTVTEVRGLLQTNLRVTLKFIGENPANNDVQTEYVFYKVNIRPQGDNSLIGDDWTQLTFEGVVEANSLANAASPFLTIRNATAAT